MLFSRLKETKEKRPDSLGEKRKRSPSFQGGKKSMMSYFLYLLMGAFVVVVFLYSVDGYESFNYTSIMRMKKEKPKVVNIENFFQKSLSFGYTCEDARCVKSSNETKRLLTLPTCEMLCSEPALWPKPKRAIFRDKDITRFVPTGFQVIQRVDDVVRKDLDQALAIFRRITFSPRGKWSDSSYPNVTLTIDVKSNVTKLSLATDEKYVLKISKRPLKNIQINISAPNFYGARHALDTLSQLIWIEDQDGKTFLNILHDVSVNDQPSFSHRGLMVDTARNYFPVRQLKNVIEGMAFSKLNVLHLHLTDAVSFPIILPHNKKFAEYGAYSPKKVYTPKDIKGLVEYARIRGIRTVLEVDAPSHVNEGWRQAEQDLIICGEDDVANGHLNPDSNHTMPILESIYRDLLELGTDDTYFHIGVDEVNTTCFSTSKRAQSYPDILDLWIDITNDMLETVKSANDDKLPRHVVLWSSALTDYNSHKLKYQQNIVVQYWYGNIYDVLTRNFKVIFSTVGKWYLDCGFGGWKPSDTQGSCNPYTTWQTFYMYKPWVEYSNHKRQILGGEACIWAEMTDEDTLETRIWPRASAMAERLWSDPQSVDFREVFNRLSHHRQRLVRLGVKAQAIWPEWCWQHPGRC